MLTIEPPDSGVPDQAQGLLELGTSSLKLHLLGQRVNGVRAVETYKFSWRVGHWHFAGGPPAGASPVSEVIDCLREAERLAPHVPLATMPAVATGVFRELPGFELLSRQIAAATGVRPVLLDARAEAEAIADSLRSRMWAAPAALFDIGGASTEWVTITAGGAVDCGSLPLGAIRNAYAQAGEAVDACDRLLAPLPLSAPVALAVTGGTARALSTMTRQHVITRDELEAVIARVRRDGPPPEVGPSRAPVLLPGLLILSRIALRCGAAEVRTCEAALRLGLVLRHLARGCTAAPPSPFEREGFAEAVRQALRAADRMDLLAHAALCQSRLAMDACPPGAGRSARAAALFRLFRTEADRLLGSPLDRDARRAFERTYLEPVARKQEVIAAELGLAYSTYRRHLATAVRRLIDALWERELEISAASAQARDAR